MYFGLKQEGTDLRLSGLDAAAPHHLHGAEFARLVGRQRPSPDVLLL